MDDPQSVTLHLDASYIPGVSDAGHVLEIHARHVLVYGMCRRPHSIVRADPERRTAEIEVLKTRRGEPFLPGERDEALSMRIDRDLAPEHWAAVAALPQEPDDEPLVTLRFEWQGREFLFDRAVLDLHGIQVPLSNPRPLIRFFRRELEELANQKSARHPCEIPPRPEWDY
jgi:hypothetical protein